MVGGSALQTIDLNAVIGDAKLTLKTSTIENVSVETSYGNAINDYNGQNIGGNFEVLSHKKAKRSTPFRFDGS